MNWKLLHLEIEVILLGDEEGAAEVYAELGLCHEPRVERSGRLPYVNFMFARAQQPLLLELRHRPLKGFRESF